MTGISDGHGFHARLVQDHMVVVDKARGEMRVLNPSAALLWLLLDESPHDAASLTRTWAAGLRDPPAELASVVRATLDEWLGLDWLEVSGDGLRISRRPPPELDGLRGRGVYHSADTHLPEHALVADMSLRLGARAFHVRLGETEAGGFPDTLARLHGVLTGLVDQAPAEDAVELRWVHDGESFWLASPDALLRTGDESLALSGVVTALFQHAYAKAGLFATLHAAAVSRNQAALLLPGVSGSGKSTLAAYLAAHGWDYLGDDVIALGRVNPAGPFLVHPFPTAIGIKPGSWPVLRPYFPIIDDLPVIAYADRKARFLPLPSRLSVDGPRQCLQAIVLPRYTPGEGARLEAIGPVDALCDLIESGVTTGNSIDASRVDILLDMLEALPVYRLRHGDLGEAAALLESLLPCT